MYISYFVPPLLFLPLTVSRNDWAVRENPLSLLFSSLQFFSFQPPAFLYFFSTLTPLHFSPLQSLLCSFSLSPTILLSYTSIPRSLPSFLCSLLSLALLSSPLSSLLSFSPSCVGLGAGVAAFFVAVFAGVLAEGVLEEAGAGVLTTVGALACLAGVWEEEDLSSVLDFLAGLAM